MSKLVLLVRLDHWVLVRVPRGHNRFYRLQEWFGGTHDQQADAAMKIDLDLWNFVGSA